VQEWLNQHVHRQGSLHPSGDDLMKAVTGSPLDPAAFLGYLRAKYSALYKVEL
jgi:carboxypeptidase Taq